MKKLFLILVTATTLFGCDKSDDPDINISGIDSFLGEWVLQSRTLNGVNALAISSEQLIITDDNSLANYKGKYQFAGDQISSGNFALDNRFVTITFTSNTGQSRTYRYFLNSLNLQFFIAQDNGDIITENWVRVLD